MTGLVGLAFSGSLALLASLLVVRAVDGILQCTPPPDGRLAANWVPPEGLALANGLITGAACAGMTLSYPVFGAMIDQFSWPGAFLVASGVTLAVAIAWTLVGSNRPQEQAVNGEPYRKTSPPAPAIPDPPGGFLSLLADRNLICLTLSYAAVGYFEYLFFYWAEFYF